MHGSARRRSASGCSATPSWARRTRTRTARLPYMTWPPPLVPRLVSIAGRDEAAVAEAAEPLRLRAPRHRLARARRRPGGRAVRQQRPEQPPCRADDRRRRGRASTCSARSRSDARRTRATRSGSASQQPGVKHMTAFNYRFVPAVRLARAADRGRRARRDPSLPRPLPAGVGHDDRRCVALQRATRRAPVRSAISART